MYEDYGDYDYYDEKPKRKRKTSNTRLEKDYLPEAIITFFLYWAGWIVGFFVNWFLLNQAANRRKNEGEVQHNVGCLRFMMWINVIPLILIVLSIFLLVATQ